MAFATVHGFALVTGAAAGIGEEVGFAFAEAGAAGVVFAEINEDGAATNAEKSKGYASNKAYKALSIKVDVTDPVSVQAMVDFVVQNFGRIDYSVKVRAYLGATSGAPTTDIDIANFDATLAVNLKGVMLCVRAVSKIMSTQEVQTHQGRHGERSLGRGSIINLGSAASYVPGPGMMAYVASKHALIGITKTAALDNVKHQIRVNALCPSYVSTPMLERSLGRWAALGKIIASKAPAGRPAFPEEVANVAVFMCGPSASYVNGTGLLIDSGMFLTANV